MKKSYRQKLLDPRWQRRRLEIFERDKFSCTVCGRQDQTLCIHHRVYGNEPWDVVDDALVSMCWQCHQQIEDDLKFLSEAFRTVNPDRLSKIVLAIHKYNTIRSKKKKKLALDLWLESLSKALARF